MEETSSDLSSVGDTLISDTQTSTMGSNLSTGTYWKQARLQQTESGSGSMTTDEGDLSPGQRESIAQESQKEMQARVHMWHEDKSQLNSQDSRTTEDSIDLWQARSRDKTRQPQPAQGHTDTERTDRLQSGHLEAREFSTEAGTRLDENDIHRQLLEHVGKLGTTLRNLEAGHRAYRVSLETRP
jgi:hypothetical protein